MFAYWLTLSFWGTTVILTSMLARNVAGQTKKLLSTASLFVAWAVGNTIGPQVFQSKDAPRYFTCFSVHMGCYGAIIIPLVVLWMYLRSENKKKEAVQVCQPSDILETNGERHYTMAETNRRTTGARLDRIGDKPKQCF